MKRLPLIVALLATVLSTRAEQVSPYIFYSFEDENDFPTGPLTANSQGLQVLTPEATVVQAEGTGASRHLDVSGAAVLVANRFTGNGQSHLEIWVKPSPAVLHDGAEFIDYDGAAVALFRSPDGNAELHALHVAEDQTGFWVSTGIHVPVEAGAAKDWHRINITQQWELGTWDLSVDGAPVLQGLGRGACAAGKLFEVWLYGNGADVANRFDDLLISADSPDILESKLADMRKARPPSPAERQSKEKKVSRQTSDSKRRQHSLPSPDHQKAGKARVLNIGLEVVGGGRHIGEFESKDKAGREQKFALYTPGYDENGKPKPLQIRIRCDAKLEEGASLGQIEWAVTEHPKDGDKKVRVIVFGTFANGPSLNATVPSEWSNKALSIQCGQLGLTKH